MLDTIQINNKVYGNSKLVCYAGHNGLMDFNLHNNYTNYDKQIRSTIILACYSKKYFAPLLANANIKPLVWSTGFMSPEAYTLHDAIDAYISNANAETICNKAASAYSKYQKCSFKAARNLLVN